MHLGSPSPAQQGALWLGSRACVAQRVLGADKLPNVPAWRMTCGCIGQVRGSLMGDRQDATLLLTDFPIALLQPVLRSMPGLQHTQPAVGLTGDTLGV